MIRIMYNPTDFALVFSVASILLRYERYERCLVMPTETKDLLLNSPENLPLLEMYNKSDYEDEEDDDYNDFFSETNLGLEGQDDEEEKIILVGIHPTSPEEEVIINEFVYFNRDKIILWIDNYDWPEKILKYVKSENDNINVSPDLTCFEIIMGLKMAKNKPWLNAEKAIQNMDLSNKMARRYVHAMLVNRTTGKNYQRQEDFDFYLFMSIVNEIISKAKNPLITELEDSFIHMKSRTTLSKKKLTDQNPIFRRAKKLGRPVGSIMLGKVQSYLDIHELLDYGLEKYPWLCVVSATIDNRKYLFMESKKIPIRDIMSLYKDVKLAPRETLKLVNVELLKFKPRRVRNKNVHNKNNKKPDH